MTVVTEEKLARRNEARQQKRANLNLVRLGVLKGRLTVDRALTLIMMLQLEPSADGQAALGTVITKALEERA